MSRADKALRLLALSLLIWISTGCDVIPGAFTPEMATWLNSTRMSPESAASFQVLGTRQWEHGVVVLYTYLQPAQGQMPPMQIFGYSLVVPSGWGTWQTIGGGAGGSSFPRLAENLIDYSYGAGGSSDHGEFSIVYGHSLVPDIATIEVTFDNGHVLRDDASDGAFAVVISERVGACELRVLNVQGQVLKRIDTSAETAIGKEPGGPPMNSCPK